MKTIYVAGPMTGIPYYNFPAFKKAASFLRESGWQVISPAELDEVRGILPDALGHPMTPEAYEEVMADDLERLDGVNAIYLLKGWNNSSGAKRELKKALEKGLTIYVEV